MIEEVDSCRHIFRGFYLGKNYSRVSTDEICPDERLVYVIIAGVAIAQHAGPEMLRMLSGHMIGENKARFDGAIEEILDCSRQSLGSSQLHLI